MERELHYSTVSEAINSLRARGYDHDFNIESDYIICGIGKFGVEEFEITDVYRYEGNTDPADEAAVYAIESSSGIKGTLVTSYGVYADALSEKILRKLSRPAPDIQ